MTEQVPAKSKLFFPNLDGLRFFCFLIVFLYHCNETIFKRIANDDIRNTLHFIFQNGNAGVNIFFVLSGFLITMLLVREKEFQGTISLKNFYLRRMLRIWPLFYLCIFLGFFVFPFYKYHAVMVPEEHSNFYYYLFFAGNFDLIRIWPKLPDALTLVVLWSVAVEEQFYLTWPVFIKYINRKMYPVLFAAIIIFTLVFRWFHTGHTDADYGIRYFHTFSVIGDMALGGMIAWYCSYDSPLLRFIKNMRRWQIILLYILTLVVILYKKVIFYDALPLTFERLVLAILFAFIIAEQNYAEHSFFKFSKFRTISKLGIYTYGLYCLQFIGIILVQQLGEKMGFDFKTLPQALTACLLALIFTIAISMSSYHLFEKHFLKLKDRFAFIVKK
ncbi:MAG: acyltransferase [Ferruginibacter sp.]